MGVTVRLDLGDLRQVRGQLKGARRLMRAISTNLAEEAINLTREGFRKAQSPSGSAWAPTQKGNKPLHGPTGALRNSWHRRSVGASGFTIASAVSYARYHQDGTSRIPVRRMVPSRTLPGRWRRAMESVAEEILEQHFG